MTNEIFFSQTKYSGKARQSGFWRSGPWGPDQSGPNGSQEKTDAWMSTQEPRAEELHEVREAQASRSEEVTGEEADLSQNKLKTFIMECVCGQGSRTFTQGGGETCSREQRLNT